MSLNEIAMALTAYLLAFICRPKGTASFPPDFVKWGNRVAENDNINTLTAIVVVLTNIPATLYLLYFMGKSVWCYFGK